MERRIYDCILIHTPKFNHYIHPLNKVGFINIIATGLFSMADILEKNGFSVKIIHIGIEKLLNPEKSVVDIIREFPAKVYGISLQWHFQAYDAIELARVIKEVRNDSFVVLGGLAASFFKNEIMEQFDFIDAIISGEGEIPLLNLVENIQKKRSLYNVPNLIFREGDKIIKNREIYYADDEQLSSLNFSRIDLLNNYNHYNKLSFFTKYPDSLINKLFKLARLYVSPPIYVSSGRGCPYNCSFCSGGYNMRHLLMRKHVGFRSVDSVLRDMEHIISLGFNHMVFTHYYDKRVDYYLNLIMEYKKYLSHLSKINFDVWELPPFELIDAFSELNNSSVILLLVYSLSEKVREKNHIHNYTNSSLLKLLDYANKKRVKIRVIVQSGLPFEDTYEIKEINRVYKELISKYKNIVSFSLPTELSPGSPMYNNPEKYHIVKTLNSFMDFYNAHKIPRYTIGYYFKSMSEREMLKLKCDTQCFIHPIYGKYICKMLHRITK